MKRTVSFAIVMIIATAFATFMGIQVADVSLKSAQAQVNPSEELKEQDSAPAGLSSDTDPIPLLIANVINLALSFVGIILVIYILYAGYLWWTARGNDDQVTKAKTILRNAIIGILIIMLSRALVSFLIRTIFVQPGQQTFSEQTSEQWGEARNPSDLELNIFD